MTAPMTRRFALSYTPSFRQCSSMPPESLSSRRRMGRILPTSRAGVNRGGRGVNFVNFRGFPA